ncbi:MAG: phosphoenolpyruvate-utilizing protein [Deltaproteobacteria bacterium]|nr:phosphoenolpyruvate-utilizing protein [Deltaproteobacteria bacterium]
MRKLTTCLDFDPDLDFEATPIWVLDKSHCDPPWTPLFGWYWANFCYLGGSGAMETVSLPYSRSTIFRLRNGGVYYGFSLVQDEDEVRKREANFRKFIRPYLEDYEKNWKGYLENEMLGHYERLKNFDISDPSARDLWDHIEDCFTVTRRMWYLHVLGMYITWLPYILLENLCKQFAGIDDTDAGFLDLVTGFDNKIFQVERKLWQLSKKARDLDLYEIFSNNTAREVIPNLENIDSGKTWLIEFQEFLQEDGWRSPRRAEFIAPTWIEDPTPAIHIIKLYLKKTKDFDLNEQREKATRKREEAERVVLSKVPDEQKGLFKKLLKVAQEAGAYGEQHSYYCEDYCFALTRRAFMALGRRYVEAGTFDSADDIFFLLPEEISRVLYTPQMYNLRPLVSERRKEWEGWCKEGNPDFLLKEGATPDEVGPHLTKLADPIFFKAILGTMPRVSPGLKADLYGVTGSPGVAEGPARVILHEKELPFVEEGDILIAVNTAPSWTSVFSLVNGAVIDRGGSLAHASIVGREYGIPVVVNVLEGTKKIKTGQRIRVDANMGAVYFLEG